MKYSAYYFFEDIAGLRAVCHSPEEVQHYLRDHASWPAGSYDVLVAPSLLAMLESSGVEWGVAIKKPDGSVQILQEPA